MYYCLLWLKINLFIFLFLIILIFVVCGKLQLNKAIIYRKDIYRAWFPSHLHINIFFSTAYSIVNEYLREWNFPTFHISWLHTVYINSLIIMLVNDMNASNHLIFEFSIYYLNYIIYYLSAAKYSLIICRYFIIKHIRNIELITLTYIINRSGTRTDPLVTLQLTSKVVIIIITIW